MSRTRVLAFAVGLAYEGALSHGVPRTAARVVPSNAQRTIEGP
jgi:hypothetical protein